MLWAALQPLAMTLQTRPPLVSSAARASRTLTAAMTSGPDGLDAEDCFLIDTEEGRKYVCTENPSELAWFLGLEESALKKGAKPDDLELVECAEDWSSNGTPEWVCVEREPASATDAPPKFKPLQSILGRAGATVVPRPSVPASDERAAADDDDDDDAKYGEIEDACYLVGTDEGTKYVCTDEPAELAWFLGLDESALKKGAKPDDLALVECAEDWSHNGTPEWVCRAQEEAGVERPAPKFKPLRSLAQVVTRVSGGAKRD